MGFRNPMSANRMRKAEGVLRNMGFRNPESALQNAKSRNCESCLNKFGKLEIRNPHLI